MAEIYASVAFFLIACAVVVRIGLYLPAFFFLCYMLPFLPIFAATAGVDCTFWNDDRFVFAPDSEQVQRLSLVWLMSSLGVIVGVALSFIRISTFGKLRLREPAKSTPPTQSIDGIRMKLIFTVSAILVLFRTYTGGDVAEAASLPGMEIVICIVLLLCWVIAIQDGSSLAFLPAFGLTGLYIWSQVSSGDRDFFLIIIALGLLLMARHRKNWTMLLSGGIAGFVVILSGTAISMLRMDVDLSVDELITYLFFNSWNATILPVILMIEEEWVGGTMLLGKSYLDLLLSVAPTPIFQLFGAEKPITVDNPAFWFFIEGLGGMHAVGVALRNFGLAGVFIQITAFSYALCKLERYCVATQRLWPMFLYVTVAGATMHALWYSLISMVNALLLFGILYLLFGSGHRKTER